MEWLMILEYRVVFRTLSKSSLASYSISLQQFKPKTNKFFLLHGRLICRGWKIVECLLHPEKNVLYLKNYLENVMEND